MYSSVHAGTEVDLKQKVRSTMLIFLHLIHHSEVETLKTHKINCKCQNAEMNGLKLIVAVLTKMK